jgi:uridine phosphorylase
MIDFNKPVVRPVRTPRTPNLPPLAIMVATRTDLNDLSGLLKVDETHCRPLYISRLYIQQGEAEGFSMVGPVVGAPYAVMLLETLAAWGARRVVFLGWCGAVSEHVNIGDIVLPTTALIDEGTSRHYVEDGRTSASASDTLTAAIRSELTRCRIDFVEGAVWTTDGIFRETVGKVRTHQANAVLGVEMELSALFSVGETLGVETGGLLVVSDDLSSLQWQPGFKDERFKRIRRRACDTLVNLIRLLGRTDG